MEPRHVTVPIRKFLGRRAKFVMAEVEAIDLAENQVAYRVEGMVEAQKLHFDHLILAPGSVTKFPPIPGLEDHAFQLKSLSDSIEFRDRGVRLLEMANTVADREERRALLRIVIVGSNFSGIELAGEYQEFLSDQAKSYPNIAEEDVQVVVVEYADRILPAIDADLARFARRNLEDRGVVVHTKTSLSQVCPEHVVLTTGEKVRTHTTVWCAGIAPSPLLKKVKGLPLDERGYIRCAKTSLVNGFDNVWAVGDSAFIPDSEGKPYAATAQNASRQGALAAENVLHQMRGEALKEFDYNPVGSLAAIGCRSAVARVFGVKLSGFLAWWLFRTVYLMKMPSWSRRVRIVIDWTLSLFFKQEPVQLGVRER